MSQFLFLREDLEELDRKIAEVQEIIKMVLKNLGEGTESESNTWHDNPAYDEGQRQNIMWSNRAEELSQIRRQAKFVEPTTDNSKIRLGKTVTIIDELSGLSQTFQIGSYMVLKERNAISYCAPLGKLLIGAAVGEEREGVMGGAKKRFKVIKIE